jgi:hypothetical protein
MSTEHNKTIVDHLRTLRLGDQVLLHHNTLYVGLYRSTESIFGTRRVAERHGDPPKALSMAEVIELLKEEAASEKDQKSFDGSLNRQIENAIERLQS